MRYTVGHITNKKSLTARPAGPYTIELDIPSSTKSTRAAAVFPNAPP